MQASNSATTAEDIPVMPVVELSSTIPPAVVLITEPIEPPELVALPQPLEPSSSKGSTNNEAHSQVNQCPKKKRKIVPMQQKKSEIQIMQEQTLAILNKINDSLVRIAEAQEKICFLLEEKK